MTNTPHEAKDNYIMEAIRTNEPKAKDIKAITNQNGDITYTFKVGRKKQSIDLKNLDYEIVMADIKKPFIEPIQEYHRKLDEASLPVRDEYKDMLEEYQDTLSRETEKFAVGEINKYFSLEKDLELTK